MISFVKRLAYLIAGWLFIGIVYSGSVYFQYNPTLLTYSFIDLAIPFSEHAVWTYLSFFLIIPFCFFCAPYANVRWMSLSFIGCGLIAGICFIAFPTMLDYNAITTPSVSTILYNQVVATDVELNCFPSLHVALTVLVVWGTLSCHYPKRSILLILWGIAICLSIIQLRRHVFIDLVAGLLLAISVGCMVRHCIIR